MDEHGFFGREFKYAEGVTEISLGLERSDYPR